MTAGNIVKKDDVACCVLFKNKYYLPVSSENIKRYFRNKTECMVIEAFDGSLYVNILDILYLLEDFRLPLILGPAFFVKMNLI